MARRDAFKGEAHFGDLIEIRRVERRYPGAMVGHCFQNALGLQNLEGFAHRYAADVELPRDIGFDQALSGLQHALGHGIHQDIGHRVGKRALAVIGASKANPIEGAAASPAAAATFLFLSSLGAISSQERIRGQLSSI